MFAKLVLQNGKLGEMRVAHKALSNISLFGYIVRDIVPLVIVSV